MTRIRVRTIVWDEFNTYHITKHKVSQDDVAWVVDQPAYHKRTYGGRYLLVRRVGSRIISVVVKREKPTVYYIVTARDSDKKERRRVYEKEKSQ